MSPVAALGVGVLLVMMGAFVRIAVIAIMASIGAGISEKDDAAEMRRYLAARDEQEVRRG